MKYIIVRNEEGSESAILFPESLSHKDVARIHRVGQNYVVSAGFCLLAGAGHWVAHGESDSLRMKSRPAQDAQILAASFPKSELGPPGPPSVWPPPGNKR